MIKTLVFLMEEESMRETLKAVLPQILPDDVAFHLLIHEGKQDLEKAMEREYETGKYLRHTLSLCVIKTARIASS